MLCLDTNILVNAARRDLPDSQRTWSWLNEALAGDELVVVPTDAGASFLRVTTNARIFAEPNSAEESLAFLRSLGDCAVFIPPSRESWALFTSVVEELGLTADDVPDAYIAAQAMDLGAVLVTHDRGFHRFPQLEVLHI